MITTSDVFKEIVHPKKVADSENNKYIWTVIYKGIYMCIRLLLDIRTNQRIIAEKQGIEFNKGEK